MFDTQSVALPPGPPYTRKPRAEARGSLFCARASRRAGCWSLGDRLPDLFHSKQFDVKVERGVGRNLPVRRATSPVAQAGRDNQLPPATRLHRGDALVPARDDLALAQGETERLIAVQGAIEFGAILERAGIVDDDGLSGLRARALADLQVEVLQ